MIVWSNLAELIIFCMILCQETLYTIAGGGGVVMRGDKFTRCNITSPYGSDGWE